MSLFIFFKHALYLYCGSLLDIFQVKLCGALFVYSLKKPLPFSQDDECHCPHIPDGMHRAVYFDCLSWLRLLP